jgi:hypothetical protein
MDLPLVLQLHRRTETGNGAFSATKAILDFTIKQVIESGDLASFVTSVSRWNHPSLRNTSLDTGNGVFETDSVVDAMNEPHQVTRDPVTWSRA